MATPTTDTYSVSSGQPVAGGRYHLPAWRRNIPLNTWTEITGTTYGNGAIDAWGGLALKPSNSELITVAPGGHGDSSYNGADSIALSANTPTWVNRYAGSAATENVLYYADGTPTSRHHYNNIHYIEAEDSVLLAGCQFGYGGGTPTGPGMDLFSLATNSYKPRYTFPDAPFNGVYGRVLDGAGRVWTNSGDRFDPVSKVWTDVSGTIHPIWRMPVAFDSNRNLIVNFQWGDGFGSGSGLYAVKIDSSSGSHSNITINSSAAYTAWLAAAPAYAAMDYDADNDRFLFYHGGETGKVYVITPNSGTAWDMSVLSTAGTPASTPASGAGINKRFLYVPNLKGFVLMPKSSANLWFLRTA